MIPTNEAILELEAKEDYTIIYQEDEQLEEGYRGPEDYYDGYRDPDDSFELF